MNDLTSRRDRWLIPATFLLALIVDRMILPVSLAPFRPELLALLVIYWSLTAPHRVGVTIAWVLGLLVDAASGGLLGLSAMVFSLQAYASLVFYQQIRVLPRFQQTLFVLIVLTVGKLLAVAVLALSGRLPGIDFWFSLPSSALLWPLLDSVMRQWRKQPAFAS